VSTPAIESRGLCRTFRTRHGFLGPNGAGKTTTLRMLATLLPPTGGEAAVAGHDLRGESARVRRRIGYVGQRSGADPAVSGRSELVFQGRLYGPVSGVPELRKCTNAQFLGPGNCAFVQLRSPEA
jgi:ABC-2 type transport system ATP-binding protein